MDRVSTESAIHVTPASDIMYLWPQKNQLTLYTGGVLHADTEYSVTIDATAEDLDGIKLGNPFSFSFKTAPVSINYSSPRNGELFVTPSSPIYLYFNTYMQKSSVQNAFSISPGISGTLDWYYDSKTTMQFTHSQNFQYNTNYTVVIDTRAKDIFGSDIKESYTFSFVIRPE
jgi:hypothetical protein